MVKGQLWSGTIPPYSVEHDLEVSNWLPYATHSHSFAVNNNSGTSCRKTLKLYDP